jgi:mRNA interferase HigB
MRVISRKALLEFSRKHPDAYTPLDDWYRITRKAAWKNLTQVRVDFPHSDSVGKCTVFNISGNKHRLIARIEYQFQAVYIKYALTHKAYDQGAWKRDC